MRLLASQIDLALDNARALLDRLDLPSRDEYITAAADFLRDARAAGASSWTLAYLTFRPLIILLGILGHYLAILLRIIAQNSIAHGWVAAKRGYFQLRTGTIWFVQFQRDLPLSAKYAELGAIAVLATLWLLRRHVQKHRYVERTVAWYAAKKRRALRKYNNFVGRVAKTSSFLAMLLPHLLYLVLVVGVKRLVPGFVTYLATGTYLCSFISFWHPMYLTFCLLGRLSPHLKEFREAESSESSGKGKAVKLKHLRQKEAELKELRAEAIVLLKYWVVYAVILAIVWTGRLLPFVGHVLNVRDEAPTGVAAKKSGLYANLRLSGRVAEEIALICFLWLRFMPSPPTDEEEEEEKQKKQLSPMRKQLRKIHVEQLSPVDLLFSKLSPIVLSAMNSSAFLSKRALGETSNGGSTLASLVIQKMKSFLDFFVLVRLISKETQEWLITTVVESSALLPAATTLLMPSYFTSYGVIYVSQVVPAGFSISACNAMISGKAKRQLMTPEMADAARYLQFWVVHAAVSLLLGWFAPFLAWVPLSTHATWFLWAYVQLESSTRKIYGWVESEIGQKNLEDTALVRSTRRIIAALPSNVDESSANAPTGEKSKVA
ncbi:hypothetical protein ACHAXT_008327 [Thalassiosira profunda]